MRTILRTLRDEKCEKFETYERYRAYVKRFEREQEEGNDEDIKKNIIEIETDDGLCLICKERERETFCHPCGHMTVCEYCSLKIASTDELLQYKKRCILCKQDITCIDYLKSSKSVNL